MAPLAGGELKRVRPPARFRRGIRDGDLAGVASASAGGHAELADGACSGVLRLGAHPFGLLQQSPRLRRVEHDPRRRKPGRNPAQLNLGMRHRPTLPQRPHLHRVADHPARTPVILHVQNRGNRVVDCRHQSTLSPYRYAGSRPIGPSSTHHASTSSQDARAPSPEVTSFKDQPPETRLSHPVGYAIHPNATCPLRRLHRLLVSAA
jgi:hypothetical protein